MNRSPFGQMRKSHVELDEIYFWTASINKWQPLLFDDRFKDVIIDCLEYLSGNGNIDVFAFVIMPTHLHFIWRMLEWNGKESPKGSFLKYTAHQFKKMLKSEGYYALRPFQSEASNKKYEFWQPDPLAIPLRTKKVAIQKLNYVHQNPVSGRWQLAGDFCGYKYSSAKFYEMGDKYFPFLKDLYEEF